MYFKNLSFIYFTIYLSLKYIWYVLEAVTQRCSVKKVFLEISQNSQENTFARVSFLIKLQAEDLKISLYVRVHIKHW